MSADDSRQERADNYSRLKDRDSRPGGLIGNRLVGFAFILGDCFLAERSRWILWAPVFMAVGIGFYFALPVEPPPWLGALGVSLCFCGLVGTRRRTSSAAVLLGLLLLAGLAATLGLSAAQYRAWVLSGPVLLKKTPPVWVSGRVVDLLGSQGDVRILLDKLTIRRLSPGQTPHRVRVRVRSKIPADLRIGEHVRLLAVLLPPPEPDAPGSFDVARWAYFQDIGAFGYALSAVKLVPELGRDIGIASIIGDLRQRIGARIRRALPGQTGAMAAALLTGDRGSVTPHTLTIMRDSGLVHLLAISGLHMGLVASWLFIFVRGALAVSERLTLNFPIKKWAAAIALLGALFYMLIAGATIPTQRAFIMVAFALGAVLLDRNAVSMRTVAWAAVVILLWRPESLLSAGFQMSFAAVVALVAVYESNGERLGDWRRGGGVFRRIVAYPLGILITTMVASGATAPFAMFHFNRVARYAIAANLLAVPIMALWVMPAGLIAFLLMPLGLEGLALTPMGWGIDAILFIAATVAGWGGAVGQSASYPSVVLPLIALSGLWLCLWCRPWRYLALLALALMFLLAPPLPAPLAAISGNGKLFAGWATGSANDGAKKDGGVYFSSFRAGSRTRESWLRRWGGDARRSGKEGPLRCDGLGCVFNVAELKFAFVRDPRALPEDCLVADVIIAAVPVGRACRRHGLVIDWFDLWRHGAHAIYRDGRGGLRIDRVSAHRGKRPWVRPRKARQ